MRSYESVIEKLACLGEGDLAIFGGAGISYDSGIPLALELIEYILKKLGMPEEHIGVIKSSFFPFEAYMDIFINNSNNSSLLDLFMEGIPNGNHEFISKLASKGILKTIVTTNFDCLIEKCLEKSIKKNIRFKEEEFALENIQLQANQLNVYKIHGSIENQSSIRTTLSQITLQPWIKMRRNVIDYLFFKGDHKVVLVLGYSFSDTFDINPQIVSLIQERLDKSISTEKPKTIIIIAHSKEGTELENIVEADTINNNKNPFKASPSHNLKKYPIEGNIVKCPTSDFLKALCKARADLRCKFSSTNQSRKWEKVVDGWVDCVNDSVANFMLGLICQKISNYKLAEVYFNKASKAVVSDNKVKSDVYHQLGIIYNSKGLYEDALKYHNLSLAISEELEDLDAIATSYQSIGYSYQYMMKTEKALDYYNKAVEISKEVGHIQNLANCYNQMGIICQERNEYDKAEGYYLKSLEIKKKLGDISGQAHSIHQIGQIYFEKNKIEEAEKYIRESRDIEEKIGNKKGLCESIRWLGIICHKKNDLDGALRYYNEALRINEEIGDYQQLAWTYGQLGVFAFESEDINNALTYFHKSLELSEKIKDNLGCAKTYLNLGNLYYKLNQLEESAAYYQKALKIYTEIGDMEEITSIKKVLNQITPFVNYSAMQGTYETNLEGVRYMTEGDKQFERGDFDEALKYYKKAAGAFKNNNNNLKLTWALGQMGLILRNKGLLDEALKNYKEMLPLIEKTCNLADKARTYLELGNIYIEKENTAEAIKSAEMALAIFKNIRDDKGTGYCHFLIGQIYYINNEDEASLQSYLNAYKLLRSFDKKNADLIKSMISELNFNLIPAGKIKLILDQIGLEPSFVDGITKSANTVKLSPGIRFFGCLIEILSGLFLLAIPVGLIWLLIFIIKSC